ncbi:MAG: helix-turn-helix transcriptional regulator [Lachnospiraceae bacterium]|nr:helix-turn-helix transcriptional regulator [Lachnospiraceae bacterium]
MTTSEKLVLLRGNRTQSEVAKGIGITTSAYSNYEQGIRTPRDTIKRKIADYYEKSVEYIFFDRIDHEM